MPGLRLVDDDVGCETDEGGTTQAPQGFPCPVNAVDLVRCEPRGDRRASFRFGYFRLHGQHGITSLYHVNIYFPFFFRGRGVGCKNHERRRFQANPHAIFRCRTRQNRPRCSRSRAGKVRIHFCVNMFLRAFEEGGNNVLPSNWQDIVRSLDNRTREGHGARWPQKGKGGTPSHKARPPRPRK